MLMNLHVYSGMAILIHCALSSLADFYFISLFVRFFYSLCLSLSLTPNVFHPICSNSSFRFFVCVCMCVCLLWRRYNEILSEKFPVLCVANQIVPIFFFYLFDQVRTFYSLDFIHCKIDRSSALSALCLIFLLLWIPFYLCVYKFRSVSFHFVPLWFPFYHFYTAKNRNLLSVIHIVCAVWEVRFKFSAKKKSI